MKFDLATGRAAGAAVPEHFLSGTNWLDGIRKWAMAGVSVLPSLALGFTTDTYVMDGEYAPNFVELASHSRASKAWEPNWDGKSGSEVGWLKEYPVDERRVGIYGPRDEAASTNQIRNPRCEGAEVGVPGVLPTNWTTNYPGGQEVVGYGTENGTPYFDVRYNGTPSGNFTIQFESSNIITAAAGQDWTLSLGVKLVAGDLANLDFVRLRVGWSTSTPSFISNSDGSDISGSIDGVHRRFHRTATAPASTGFANQALFFDYSGSGTVDFTLRIYAPQLEQSATPSSPILPTAGTPAAATRAADVVSGVTTDRTSRGWYDTQWDYTNGGVVGDLLEFLPGVPRVGPKGLLVEEGTTNHIRNPRCEGAVVGVLGAGGALPTNWAASTGGGTGAWEVVSIVDEEIELRLTGNPAGTAVVYFDTTTAIAVTNGDPYTLAVDIAVSAGDVANAGILRVGTYWHSSAGAYQAASAGQEIKSDLTTARRRFIESSTVSSASYEQARPGIYLTTPGDVDFTLKIRRPQFEKKAYPTSVVLPEAGSPAAATRAADEVSLANGAWSNDDAEGAFYFEAVLNNGGASGNYAWLAGYGSDNNNSIRVRMSATSNFSMIALDGGTTQATPSSVALTGPGQVVRGAVAWAENDFASVFNGEALSSDSSGSVGFGAGKVTLANVGSAGPTSQFIQSFRYFPTRIANTELEALVA